MIYPVLVAVGLSSILLLGSHAMIVHHPVGGTISPSQMFSSISSGSPSNPLGVGYHHNYASPLMGAKFDPYSEGKMGPMFPIDLNQNGFQISRDTKNAIDLFDEHYKSRDARSALDTKFMYNILNLVLNDYNSASSLVMQNMYSAQESRRILARKLANILKFMRQEPPMIYRAKADDRLVFSHDFHKAAMNDLDFVIEDSVVTLLSSAKQKPVLDSHLKEYYIQTVEPIVLLLQAFQEFYFRKDKNEDLATFIAENMFNAALKQVSTKHEAMNVFNAAVTVAPQLKYPLLKSYMHAMELSFKIHNHDMSDILVANGISTQVRVFGRSNKKFTVWRVVRDDGDVSLVETLNVVDEAEQ